MRAVRSIPLFAAVIAAAGCGAAHRAAAPPARLPTAVAARLGTLSDSVASALAARDGCTARLLAARLHKRAADAIEGGQVPPALQKPLRNSTDDLLARIHCTPHPRPASAPQPQPQPRPPEDEHGKGKHKGHGHGEGD